MSLFAHRNATINIAGVEVPYDLDAKGFEAGEHGPRDIDFRADRIEAAREVIRQSLKKARGEQPRTRSNWVQCKVEEKLGYFLYPGELIVAMLGEKFAFTRSGRECLFNVDTGTLGSLSHKQSYYRHLPR